MTADRDFDRMLGTWFEARAISCAPEGLLERSLERVDPTRQRAGWRIRDGGRSPRAMGRPATARASLGRMLAVVAVIAIATAAGLFLRLSPATINGPSSAPSVAPEPSASVAPSPSPTPTRTPGALIAYIRTTEKPNRTAGNPNQLLCYSTDPACPIPRLWIVRSDGSGAHELLPGGTGNQSGMAWSPDGTRLIYSEAGKLYLTDASGSTPQVVDTGCVAPCEGDWYAAFSNDGAHLAFLRNSKDASGYSGPGAIATMDLTSGRVVELSSTAPAGGMSPRWSPDGKQIVFWRGGEKDTGGPVAPTLAAVFVVDADGQNLRQISPTTLAAQFAECSPRWNRPATVDDGRDLEWSDLDTGRANPLRPRFGWRGKRRLAGLLDDGRRRHERRPAHARGGDWSHVRGSGLAAGRRAIDRSPAMEPLAREPRRTAAAHALGDSDSSAGTGVQLDRLDEHRE
jgi:hypothetical protein